MIWGKSQAIKATILVLIYIVVAPAYVFPPSHYNIIVFAFLLCLVVAIGIYYLKFMVGEKDGKEI